MPEFMESSKNETTHRSIRRRSWSGCIVLTGRVGIPLFKDNLRAAWCERCQCATDSSILRLLTHSGIFSCMYIYIYVCTVYNIRILYTLHIIQAVRLLYISVRCLTSLSCQFPHAFPLLQGPVVANWILSRQSHPHFSHGWHLRSRGQKMLKYFMTENPQVSPL